MPRIARVVAVGYPHHITQRGNYQQDTFKDEEDYASYFKWLEEYSREYYLTVMVYCLMPNHVHLIAIPEKENSLAKTFHICHTRYSQYFNKKKDMRGHLWQGRFYSCVLDEQHLYSAVRYVENNPVRAKLVKEARNWNWSSAKIHIERETGFLSLSKIYEFIDVDDWQKYLSQRDTEAMIKKIRANTLTGRPLGDGAFVQKLEELFSRRLVPLSIGRPRKRK